jgi:hypothetical protein
VKLSTRALIADGFAKLSLHSSFTALMILTFQGARATLDLGVVSICVLVPSLLFTLHSGRFLERFPPLPTFRGAALLRAAVLLVVPLAGANLLVLSLAAALAGLLQQVLSTAKLTFDATVVGSEERTRFNSKRALLSGLAVLLGPSLAGVIGGYFGAGPAVQTSAALGALSFLALWRAPAPATAPGAGPARRVGRCRAGVAAALRWLWRSEQVGILVLAYTVLLAILEMEAPLIFPFVKEAYGRGPDVSGTLLGICGLGSLAGALVMHRRNRPVGGRVLTALLVLDGVLLGLIAHAPGIPLLYLLFSALGILATVTQVTVETEVQSRAPRSYQPLLFSFTTFAGGAGGAALALGAAALADVVGAARVLIYCAGLEVAVGLGATALITLTTLAARRGPCAEGAENG